MFSRPHRRGAQTPAVNHQTIRLAAGKHASPSQGACVMELASMLAEEPFTDHPSSVCPVIGDFMRAYNDSIDSERRQDLYVYASKIVGSRADEDAKLARADRLATWAFEHRQQRRSRLSARFHERRGMRPTPAITSIGTHAVRAIKNHTDQTHAAVLTLVDELLSIGGRQQSGPLPTAAEQPTPAGG